MVRPLRNGRLKRFGFAPGHELPVASLRFRQKCQDAACFPVIAANAQSLEDYAKREDEGRFLDLLKLTATIVDLDLFPTYADYRRAVSKETKGKYHRSANKATRLGYYSRKLGLDAHMQGVLEIRRSKLVRSRGLVLGALLGAKPVGPDAGTKFQPPACPEHWRVEWGVFNQAQPDRLFAFAMLQRTGNFINVKHFIGHADALGDGVMKILKNDIMEWILAREDICVQGARYLIHGALEEGSLGLADWRRYVRLLPCRLDFADPDVDGFLADFDPQTYLDLNPDVRAAGRDAREHYLWHGVFEGRQYKRSPKSEESD